MKLNLVISIIISIIVFLSSYEIEDYYVNIFVFNEEI